MASEYRTWAGRKQIDRSLISDGGVSVDQRVCDGVDWRCSMCGARNTRLMYVCEGCQHKRSQDEVKAHKEACKMRGIHTTPHPSSTALTCE